MNNESFKLPLWKFGEGIYGSILYEWKNEGIKRLLNTANDAQAERT